MQIDENKKSPFAIWYRYVMRKWPAELDFFFYGNSNVIFFCTIRALRFVRKSDMGVVVACKKSPNKTNLIFKCYELASHF